MRTLAAIAFAALLGTTAQAQVYGSDSNRQSPYGSYGTQNSRSGDWGGLARSNPRPAADPYDRPTLGDPQPRTYGTKPALGNPSGTRRTSPKTCTGLLCD